MLEENVDEIVNMCVINPYEPKGIYKLIDKKIRLPNGSTKLR